MWIELNPRQGKGNLIQPCKDNWVIYIVVSLPELQHLLSPTYPYFTKPCTRHKLLTVTPKSCSHPHQSRREPSYSDSLSARQRGTACASRTPLGPHSHSNMT